MPFTKKDLEDLPISFCGKDDVWVIVGPCSATYWKDYKIALDGRKYKTGGTITFKTVHLFAPIFSIVALSKIPFFHSSNKLDCVYK